LEAYSTKALESSQKLTPRVWIYWDNMQVLLDWCLTTLGWQIRGLDQVLEEIGEFKS